MLWPATMTQRACCGGTSVPDSLCHFPVSTIREPRRTLVFFISVNIQYFYILIFDATSLSKRGVASTFRFLNFCILPSIKITQYCNSPRKIPHALDLVLLLPFLHRNSYRYLRSFHSFHIPFKIQVTLSKHKG